jgi:hypothetical protein
MEEGNGSLKRKRERERESGMGLGRPGEQGQCQERTPIDPSHSTKMLEEMPLTKKAHKKSLKSKSKV